jgi:hypothetical protein
MKNMKRPYQGRISVWLVWLACLAWFAGGGAALTAQEASHVLGTTMVLAPGTVPVLAEPASGARQVAVLEIPDDERVITVLATVPEPYRRSRDRYVLVDLAGAGTPSGGYRYGWVAADRFSDGALPRTEVMPDAGSRGVVLHRAPARGEDPLEIFYIELQSGMSVSLGMRDHETRVLSLLQESGVLVTSVGTGPGNPQLVYLRRVSDGSLLYGGYTWTLVDFIREDRYVRVMPWDRPEDAPGFQENPPVEILQGEPYRFSERRIAEYRRLLEQTRGDRYENVRIVPQVWLDTVTGDQGEIEYIIQRHVVQ